MANRNAGFRLFITDSKTTMICTSVSGGASRPGGYENPVTLGFKQYDLKKGLFQGVLFDSRKQAMWFWFRWRDRFPEQTNGWRAYTDEIEG